MGGCRRGLSIFPFGCQVLPSSYVATSVGRGAPCSECGYRDGGGGVRRWRRVWEQGGASARRRRAATGRPSKLDDTQIETVCAALERGTQAHGLEADLWPLERVGAVVTPTTGVVLSNASVWRLLTGRHGWSPQRPERWAISGTNRRSPAGSRTSGRAPRGAGTHVPGSSSSTNQAFSCSLGSAAPIRARGQTSLLRHRLKRKRASMAGALG
ncbi:helix-turn-helix domain-containing protein [Streptomyces sp. NPDC054844]